MKNVSLFYKDFIKFKILSIHTYINMIKKVRNLEDLRYATGLLWFGITKILIRKTINNETLRGRK